MIGIEAIGTYIPTTRIDNRARMAKFEIDEEFLMTKTGMLALAIKDKNEETSDLCCSAFEDLKKKVDLAEGDIECIVVVTQNPDGNGLPHTSAIVHGKLGLSSSCAAFDISLGCSGFVYGLSVIQGFMIANGFRRGILFTGDPYSKIIDQDDKNTALLFGDAATATLISDTPEWKTGKFLFGSQGKEGAAIQVSHSSGMLEMNGRAVFSFSATQVPNNIKTMLALNHCTIDRVDLFAMHQGSRFIVDTLQKRLSIPSEKAPFSAESYGNTVSSSIPLLLKDVSDSLEIIVIAGFGVGLSWASTLLFKIKE